MIQLNCYFDDGISYNEDKMVNYLEKELKNIGVEVEVVYPERPFQAPYHQGVEVKYPSDPSDFPVVVARLRGTEGKPVLGMTKHYNTVVVGDRDLWTVDPLKGEIIDGKIYGRGAIDDHAGIAERIEMFRVLKESGVKLKGDLVLTIVPGEGATDFGLPWVVEHGPELIAADWYLAGNIGPIFGKQGGHFWAKLTVKGFMHHPPGKVNAIHQMMKVLPAVIDVDRWMTWEDDPLFSGLKPRVDVTAISSGDASDVAVNVMPAQVEALLDVRMFPNQNIPQAVGELNKLLDELMEENPDMQVKLEITNLQKAPEEVWDRINEDDPLVQEILEFSRDFTGRQDLEMKWRGGFAGGRPDFWNAGAIVIYSGGLELPGSGGGAHGADEFVRIDGLVQMTQILVDFIQRVLGEDGINPPAKESTD
jgi:acetylornithine deacetylase/succinyl-diaminopimelate desuccinylase-like protein